MTAIIDHQCDYCKSEPDQCLCSAHLTEKLEAEFENGKEEGYKEGYEKAKEEYQEIK